MSSRRSRHRAQRQPQHAPIAAQTPRQRVTDAALSQFRGRQVDVAPQPIFAPAKPPPGVVPQGTKLAMDDALAPVAAWGNTFAQPGGLYGAYSGAFALPQLAYLAQRPEYRRMATTLATEMVRAWIELQATGDDKKDKLAAINAEMERLHVRQCFGACAEHDAFFGGAHLYLDTGDTADAAELTKSIGDGSDATSRGKVARGALKALRVVEPVWVYPQGYGTSSPLTADWYNPSLWYVMGKSVHATRLLTMVGRPAPDMLKSAYSFRGVSLSQLAYPYVENWIRTRQSVADLLDAFSIFVLSTDMSSTLGDGGDGAALDARVQLFNLMRSNRGTFVLDKSTEDFKNVQAPLGGLEGLQAQAQEQMSSVSGIPLSILLGITPSGLNASSEGEIRIFYDFVHSYQERLFRQPLKTVIDFVQLSLFGEVDPEITFRFIPLWSMSETERATLRKTEADTAVAYIDAGVITPEEERTRIAADPDTMWPGLDVADAPDLREEEEEGLEPRGGSGEGGEDPEAEERDGLAGHHESGDIAKTSLNGAQVSSMVDIVSKIAAGELTLESGRQILLTAFPIDESVVDRILTGSGPTGDVRHPVERLFAPKG